MVVIVVIGIITAVITLSVGGERSDEAKEEARRLHALIRLAGDEAVIQGRELALQFNEEGYEFYSLVSREWQPVEKDEMLRPRQWPPGVKAELELEGTDAPLGVDEDQQTKDKEAPRVFLLSSGELTPFVLTLKFEGQEGSASILRGDMNGKLTLARQGDDEKR